jgi:hypothetical protein
MVHDEVSTPVVEIYEVLLAVLSANNISFQTSYRIGLGDIEQVWVEVVGRQQVKRGDLNQHVIENKGGWWETDVN